MNKESFSEKINSTSLQIENLSISKGDKQLFSNINLNINIGDHIALVGPNGVGKTTLLQTIVGENIPDSGKIRIPKGIKIAYVPQSIENTTHIKKGQKILDYFLQSKQLDSTKTEMNKLEEYMAINEEIPENILKRYNYLQLKFQIDGGYSIESDAKIIMSGMSFSKEINLNTKISTLSGGEITKLFLAQALLKNADLLLLDEPSNHLDRKTLNWLGQYLKKYKGAILAVSHETSFLETFVRKYIEISDSKKEISIYNGNYSEYLQQKQKRINDEYIFREKTLKEIDSLEAFANKYKAGSRANLAKDREKKIKKKLAEIPEIRKKGKDVKLKFEYDKPSSFDVLKTFNISKIYGNKKLDYSKINLNIKRGEKFLISGEIGVGKSTLLKIIVGEINPNYGDIKLGKNVDIGYYSQDMSILDPDKTILEELKLSSPSISDEKLRLFLGSFLFSKGDVFKKVSVLSFGERSRLLLSKLAIQKHNFLVLDEPTNHLDIKTKEKLAEALNSYEGTILLVSHDKNFLEMLNLDKNITIY